MRRLAMLLPVALAGSLALASCSGGSPAHQATGKSATSAPDTQSSRSDHEAKELKPATVVEGMHYVQLFNTVDPVLAQMAHDAVGGTLPPGTELHSAAGSLRQFAAQARKLPSAPNERTTIDKLAAASSTLAGQLDTLAAKGSHSSDAATLTSAVSGFQSAAAAARQAVGLPAVSTSRTPQPDTGP
jgi:hypothetical protein